MHDILNTYILSNCNFNFNSYSEQYSQNNSYRFSNLFNEKIDLIFFIFLMTSKIFLEFFKQISP